MMVGAQWQAIPRVVRALPCLLDDVRGDKEGAGSHLAERTASAVAAENAKSELLLARAQWPRTPSSRMPIERHEFLSVSRVGIKESARDILGERDEKDSLSVVKPANPCFPGRAKLPGLSNDEYRKLKLGHSLRRSDLRSVAAGRTGSAGVVVDQAVVS
jgi:hypothetical protein